LVPDSAASVPLQILLWKSADVREMRTTRRAQAMAAERCHGNNCVNDDIIYSAFVVN